MNTVELLKAARAKIEKPENWTQGAFAKNAEGHNTFLGHDDYVNVTCWCAWGAVEEAAGSGVRYSGDAMQALHCALPEGTEWVPDFNDSHTHEEVLALFDRAIASEEAKTAKEAKAA